MELNSQQSHDLDKTIQGHSARIYKPDSLGNHSGLYLVRCLTCDFKSSAKTEEEAKFDIRYHFIKTNVANMEIDWDKLL